MPNQLIEDWKNFKDELKYNIEELMEKNKEQEEILKEMLSILEYSKIKIKQ